MNLKLFARSTILSTIFTLLSITPAQAQLMPYIVKDRCWGPATYLDESICIAPIYFTASIPLIILLSVVALIIFTKRKPLTHRLAAIAAPLIIIFLNSQVATHFGSFYTYTKYPTLTYPILLITGSILALLTTLAILIPNRRKKILSALIILILVYILTIIHAFLVY